MKRKWLLGIVLFTMLPATSLWAESLEERVESEQRLKNAQHPTMTRKSGYEEISSNEYIIVDLTGSITRSLCPYSCKDRGLAQDHCRAWQSGSNPDNCYVQDTRIPSDAFPGLARR